MSTKFNTPETNPRLLAIELFVNKRMRRFDILKILREKFPGKSENSLNVAMTRGAAEAESIIIKKGLEKNVKSKIS